MKRASLGSTYAAVVASALLAAPSFAVAEGDTPEVTTPSVEPDGTRSFARGVSPPDAAAADSELMYSRPGGCPEGPPCPDEGSADAKGDGEACTGEDCPEKK